MVFRGGENMKQYWEKIILAIGMIIFSPLILFAFISVPFVAIKNRIEYKKSRYYQDFKLPYPEWFVYSPCYEFYNAHYEKPDVQYVRQKSNGLEYFIYQGTVYLFPDFYGPIKYDEAEDWRIFYKKSLRKSCEQNYETLSDYIEHKKQLLDESVQDLPIRVIVPRDKIKEETLQDKVIPSSVWVVKSYDRAFEDLDWNIISVIPQNAKELHEMLMVTPDLCGDFELIGKDVIHWTHHDLFLEIDVDRISVWKKGRSGKGYHELTHWHPCCESVYDDVCKIVKKNSALVIRTFFGGARVVYSGPKEGCPNKRGIASKIHYFEIA